MPRVPCRASGTRPSQRACSLPVGLQTAAPSRLLPWQRASYPVHEDGCQGKATVQQAGRTDEEVAVQLKQCSWRASFRQSNHLSHMGAFEWQGIGHHWQVHTFSAGRRSSFAFATVVRIRSWRMSDVVRLRRRARRCDEPRPRRRKDLPCLMTSGRSS